MDRYLLKQAQQDLQRKMVFIGGPRQVGKTTLAKSLLGKDKSGYLNWDIPEDRENILQRQLPATKLIVLDEIHKYKKWRGLMKGLFDKHHPDIKFLVTGSARLDYYRYGGDSLQGRYHYLRMHPLSFAELKMKTTKDLLELLNLGGFPEPFFSSSKKHAQRWSREYRTRLLREEVRDLENVKDLGSMEALLLRLPELVGSPLSINAVREDLDVGFKAVKNWIEIFERLYVLFRVPPFGATKIRAVKKEQKHYHFDWTTITDPGTRFENLMACHLLKWVHFLQDTEGRDLELRYFRDVDGREVDFIICENKKPITAIECKYADSEVSSSLIYFKERFPGVAAYQLHATGVKEFVNRNGIKYLNATKFLDELL